MKVSIDYTVSEIKGITNSELLIITGTMVLKFHTALLIMKIVI